MRYFAALLVLLLGLASAARAADPVVGLWKTQEDDGAFAHVEFAPCGDRLCGTIVRTFNAEGEYRSENIGRRLVWDMRPAGEGKYEGGRIWQPSTDRIFKSKMTLSGDILKVAGCVAGGLICKKQTWTRLR